MVDEVAADESGAACYDDLHVFLSPLFICMSRQFINIFSVDDIL